MKDLAVTQMSAMARDGTNQHRDSFSIDVNDAIVL
jgi:hypothetical protein